LKFQKVLILIAIPLAIGLFIDNFMPGYYLDQNDWPYKLYTSFFNDLAFPFCLYFIFCLFEKWIPKLKAWQIKALLAFLVPASIEIGQLIYQKMGLSQVFMTYGGAFDPLDLVAYAAGGLLAVLLERWLFAKYFKFWESIPSNPIEHFALEENTLHD
jgi:glycopeptide antibiotics resistance protein